jgi:beta-aspartyl-peptidase (threonine type)
MRSLAGSLLCSECCTSARSLLLAAALLTAAALLAALPAHAQENTNAQPGRASTPPERPSNVVLVVHGGAGSIEEVDMTDEEEAAYRTQLAEALRAGYDVIEGGGSSLDAVEAAIQPLEQARLFNAGRGAVFTNAGMVEQDASIMEGDSLKAGAIAGTKHLPHPISAARLVMEESEHVMLARQGAEAFALAQGVDLVPNSYFYTPERRERFLETLTSDASPEVKARPERPGPQPDALGTVGAVARDQTGTLAAGTSTGGTSGKRWGRIGDSPIIGAGTYADSQTAGVSATGWGEYFIRGAVAHEVTALMDHTDASVQEAARTVINERLPRLGDGRGSGGVIALDAEGHVATPFITPGMFRGWITEDGTVTVRFYDEDQYDGPQDGE